MLVTRGHHSKMNVLYCAASLFLSLQWYQRGMNAISWTAFWYQNLSKRFIFLYRSSATFNHCERLVLWSDLPNVATHTIAQRNSKMGTRCGNKQLRWELCPLRKMYTAVFLGLLQGTGLSRSDSTDLRVFV